MCIDWILSVFPSVMRLEIKSNNKLTISAAPPKKKNSIKVYPNFSELVFAGFTIDADGKAFIESAAPNLKRLILNILELPRFFEDEYGMCEEEGSREMIVFPPFNLSSCHLDSLSLIFKLNHEPWNSDIVYIEITTDHKHVFKYMNNQDKDRFKKVTEIPSEDSSERRFTITCGSLKQIKFDKDFVYCLE